MIRGALTDEYKRLCYRAWEEKHGQQFVDEVKRRIEGEKK